MPASRESAPHAETAARAKPGKEPDALTAMRHPGRAPASLSRRTSKAAASGVAALRLAGRLPAVLVSPESATPMSPVPFGSFIGSRGMPRSRRSARTAAMAASCIFAAPIAAGSGGRARPYMEMAMAHVTMKRQRAGKTLSVLTDVTGRPSRPWLP